LTTIGVNTFTMAMPGVISQYIFSKMISRGGNLSFIGGFMGGIMSVLLSTILVSLALLKTERSFLAVVWTLLLMHLPISAIEGIITGFIVVYLKKVKPEALI